MIGIGCITYNRPKHLAYWEEQIKKFSSGDSIVYIADDSIERKGIANRTNECINKLKDCDYIFIFNDDCFPIQKGWEKFFIDSSIECGQQHYQMLIESSTNTLIAIAKDLEKKDFIQVNIYENTNGCMMFMSKICIERVGGYNTEFGLYGFEHADYSNRIHKANLTPLGKYSCPHQANKYIFALDLEAETELHRKLKHKSSIEPLEAIINVTKALPIYNNSNQLFYPI